MSDLVIRHNIDALVGIKAEYFQHIKATQDAYNRLDSTLKRVGGYSPLKLGQQFDVWGDDREEKYIDKALWLYLVRSFDLKSFMLSTEFEKLIAQLERHDFPVFTKETAEIWMEGLKGLIQNNVQTLVKQVYQAITGGHYYTGSGYASREKKKRNNMGVDRTFILNTGDNFTIWGWSYDRPTVTDDLEKIAYLLAGEKLPAKSLKATMREAKTGDGQNHHMKIIVRKNGNTQFTLSDDLRNLLNRYGPDGMSLGQDVKIRVFE